VRKKNTNSANFVLTFLSKSGKLVAYFIRYNFIAEKGNGNVSY
jgi:hypothetical protein